MTKKLIVKNNKQLTHKQTAYTHTHGAWSLQELICCADATCALTAMQRFLQSLNQEDTNIPGLGNTQHLRASSHQCIQVELDKESMMATQTSMPTFQKSRLRAMLRWAAVLNSCSSRYSLSTLTPSCRSSELSWANRWAVFSLLHTHGGHNY